MKNPQVIYGEDVMSRISYTLTNSEGLERLRRTIIKGLNNLLKDLAGQADIQAKIDGFGISLAFLQEYKKDS